MQVSENFQHCLLTIIVILLAVIFMAGLAVPAQVDTTPVTVLA